MNQKRFQSSNLKSRWLPFCLANRPCWVAHGLCWLWPLFCGCGQTAGLSDQSEVVAEPLVVNVLEAQLTTNAGQTRRFSGLVQPFQLAQLGFSRGGRISQVLVKSGDRVDAGQLLAELDNRRLENKASGLRRAVEQAQQELAALPSNPPALSSQELLDGLTDIQGRVVELRNLLLTSAGSSPRLGTESRQALNQLEQQITALNTPAIDQQRIRLEQAIEDLQAQLSDAQLELEEGKLVAPFSGSVEWLGFSRGSVIAAGRPVARVLDSSRLRLSFSVPIDFAASQRPELPLRVKVGERSHQARVESISPELDRTTRTRSLTVTWDQPSSGLEGVPRIVPGTVGELELQLDDSQEGCWLPLSAVDQDVQGLWSVLVAEPVGEDAWLTSRKLVQVVQWEVDRAFVQGSQLDGRLVVADGLHRLVAGQRIDPRPIDSPRPPKDTSSDVGSSSGSGKVDG